MLGPPVAPVRGRRASRRGPRGGRLVQAAATQPEGSAGVTIDVATAAYDVVKRELDDEVDARYVSRPEPIAFPGDDGESYGFFYALTNPEFTAPEEELAPLVVL